MEPERVNELVKRHRPRGWRVAQSRRRWKPDSAECDFDKRTIRVPTLDCDASLFLFFHECGHIVRGHWSRTLPTHVEEFEAELYAVHIFRAENIPITPLIRFRIRERLCYWIERDRERGVPIRRHIARWAHHKVKTRGRKRS